MESWELILSGTLGHVVAVCSSSAHRFAKSSAAEIRLLAGLGVEGDAHCGATVKHRSRVALDPSSPNLRQVHLLHVELFGELTGQGFQVSAGELGENITTSGLDLLALPVDSELQIGPLAVVRITGLRNPCAQIEQWQQGLLSALVERPPGGVVVRKAGVMAVVVTGGVVRPGDTVTVKPPSGRQRALERV